MIVPTPTIPDGALRLTRAAGLDRLAAVIPRTGRAYATGRNTDRGPGAEATTTVLSPFLRRRLVLEQEAVEAATAAHGPQAASRFVEEVFWRAYFKGWLETHPAVWTGYRAALAGERDRVGENTDLRRLYADAVSGSTGIEGFDDWARELTDTGWLHNHVRMWFASIWIFTLGLPWTLGADFFLRHLIDGDPASNTLSWRWVAGLHTRGRAYAARAENIRRHTAGRFSPTGLNEHPVPLHEAEPPREVELPAADAAPSGDVALLLHLDDLHGESLQLGRGTVRRVGGLLAHAPDASALVRRADADAMDDALRRAAEWFNCPATQVAEGWSGDLPIVAAWAPVGPSAASLPESCIRLRRHWDELTWPKATRGYFRLRTAIPSIRRELSLGASASGGSTLDRISRETR